jgi:glycosyltransferase involved in cell wall biosynthesis
MKWFCLLVFSLSLSAMSDQIRQLIINRTIDGQKEFAIVVPTYNNSAVCLKNIASLLGQKYDNYHIYIIDDASTDDTHKKLSFYCTEHDSSNKITLLHNTKRVGALANYYRIIHTLEDHVIVLNVDGDDWLAHDQVLHILNHAYDQDIWLTYGQFRQYPSHEIGFCRPLDPETIVTHNYRRSAWLTTHLRTYYAWLFKKIDKKDLCYEGRFIKACGDRALIYPLLEMSGGRCACIQDVLYIYNCANPLADVRVNLSEQQKMCHYICAQPAYAPLDVIRV